MKPFPPLLIAVLPLVVLPLLVPTLASGQEYPFRREADFPPMELVMGREAWIELDSTTLEGELMAVSSDSLWVLSFTTLVGVPLNSILGVDVRMHNWDTGRMLTWNLLAGVGSAFALSAACNSVDDTSGCGGVILSWTAIWGVVGGLAGIFMVKTSRREVAPTPLTLQPYVRYPQGLPPGRANPGPGPRRPGG